MSKDLLPKIGEEGRIRLTAVGSSVVFSSIVFPWETVQEKFSGILYYLLSEGFSFSIEQKTERDKVFFSSLLAAVFTIYYETASMTASVEQVKTARRIGVAFHAS